MRVVLSIVICIQDLSTHAWTMKAMLNGRLGVGDVFLGRLMSFEQGGGRIIVDCCYSRLSDESLWKFLKSWCLV